MSFLQKIFSITNEGIHKKICILGFHIKVLINRKRELAILENKLSKKLDYIENVTLKRLKSIIPYQEINTIEIHIVEHCNLNCKGCTHFAPLASEEFLDIECFTKDLIRLKELTNSNIKIFNILGGEPLLHPQCIEFLKITRQIFPNSIVKLVTNGLLLPEQNEDFYLNIKKYDITIAPTKYNLSNLEWKLFEENCKKYNVKYEYFQGSGYEEKLMFKEALDIGGSHDFKEQFLNCLPHRDCCWLWLDHGKLYKCARSAYLKHFTKYFNIEISLNKNDYVDIYEIDTIEQILNFYSKPSNLCSYCAKELNGSPRPWEKSQKSINEWIYDDKFI